MSNPKAKRIEELDALRGLAAVSLLLYHYTTRFSEKFNTNIITDVIDFRYGSYGVDLFFVISGFVIFMSIGNIKSPLDFAYKRAVRLYPTFWVCMVLTFIIISISGRSTLQVSYTDFLLNFTMLPSLFHATAVDGVYWTLKVEIIFYLMMLILLTFRKIEKIKEIGFFYICVGIVLFVFFRITTYYYYGFLFLLGINFFYIWKHKGKVWNHLQVLLCLLMTFNSDDHLRFIVAVSLVVIFYLLVYGKLQFMTFKPLIVLGKISYALYLIHQYIGYVIQLELINLGVRNAFVLLALPAFVALTGAYVITFYFEQPVIKKLLTLRTTRNKECLN